MSRPPVPLNERNVRLLEGYVWPGNARELQNVIERAVITSRPGDLCFNMAALEAGEPAPRATTAAPPESPLPGGAIISDDEMKRRERDNIFTALEQAEWRVYGKDGAAELLGIRPTTLASRIKKLKLQKP